MSCNWPKVQISEVCELIVDCVNKTAPRVNYETPFKMIRTPNIKNGKISLNDCRFVEENTYEKWTRRAKVLRDDVLLTREAPMGEVGIVDFDELVFLGQRIMQYRVDRLKLDPHFLLYSFLSSDLQHQFNMHEGSGSVVSHIRVPDCSKFELNLPPLNIQKEIATILKKLDKKIALNTQINQTLEQMAQAIFKSWFVDFDPVKAKINGAQPEGMDAATAALFPEKLVESELGLIPEDWTIATLKSLSKKISKGTTPSKKDIAAAEDEASIKFIKVKDINDQGEILRNSLEDIPNSVHIGKLKRSILETNDILFSIAGTIGRIATVDSDLNNVNTNQAVAFVRLKDKDQYLPLVYMALRSNRLQHKALASIVQGVQANLSLANIGEMQVIIPSDEVLELWNKQYSSIFKMIKSNFAQSRKLSSLRDTLLPKLLSGEIELGEH